MNGWFPPLGMPVHRSQRQHSRPRPCVLILLILAVFLSACDDQSVSSQQVATKPAVVRLPAGRKLIAFDPQADRGFAIKTRLLREDELVRDYAYFHPARKGWVVLVESRCNEKSENTSLPDRNDI